MFFDSITVTLTLVIGLILALILWVFFFRNPIAIIVVTLIVFTVNIAIDQDSGFFTIGQFNIRIMDILSIFLISIGMARILLLKNRGRIEIFLLLLLGGLLFLSWVRGVQLFGLETSTNTLRTVLYFFTELFYTATLNYSEKFFHKFAFWIYLAGFTIICIAAIRWMLVGFGEISSLNWIASNGAMVRVITASATFFLLQTLVFINFTNYSPRKKIFVSMASILLLLMIIFLQQRTVWVALVFAFILAILLKSKIKSVIILAVLFAIILAIFVFTWNNSSLDNLNGTVFDLQNLIWRITGWQSLLTPERYKTSLDYVIGQPFGTGYGRYIQNSSYETTVSPHNFYIQAFLNIGGVGLLLILITYGFLFYSLWKQRSNKISQLFIILLSTQLIFFITYAPSYEQGIILGLALSFMRREDKVIIK